MRSRSVVASEKMSSPGLRSLRATSFRAPPVSLTSRNWTWNIEHIISLLDQQCYGGEQEESQILWVWYTLFVPRRALQEVDMTCLETHAMYRLLWPDEGPQAEVPVSVEEEGVEHSSLPSLFGLLWPENCCLLISFWENGYTILQKRLHWLETEFGWSNTWWSSTQLMGESSAENRRGQEHDSLLRCPQQHHPYLYIRYEQLMYIFRYNLVNI